MSNDSFGRAVSRTPNSDTITISSRLSGAGDYLGSYVFDLSRGNRWPDPYTGRVLRNRHTERWLGHEDELATEAERIGREYAAARERGDSDIAGVIAGEACALIQDIPPAGEIVRRIVAEAEHLLPTRLGGVG